MEETDCGITGRYSEGMWNIDASFAVDVLKRFVDLAWISDAESVCIALRIQTSPGLTNNNHVIIGHVIIKDDGLGMSREDVEWTIFSAQKQKQNTTNLTTELFKRQIPSHVIRDLPITSIVELLTWRNGNKILAISNDVNRGSYMPPAGPSSDVDFDIQTEHCSSILRGTIVRLHGFLFSSYRSVCEAKEALLTAYANRPEFTVSVVIEPPTESLACNSAEKQGEESVQLKDKIKDSTCKTTETSRVGSSKGSIDNFDGAASVASSLITLPQRLQVKPTKNFQQKNDRSNDVDLSLTTVNNPTPHKIHLQETSMTQAHADPEEIAAFSNILQSYLSEIDAMTISLQQRFAVLSETWQDQEQQRFEAELDQLTQNIRRISEAAQPMVPYLIARAEHLRNYLGK
jgi:uncharacterized protein YukE